MVRRMRQLGIVAALIGLLWADAGQAAIYYSQNFDGLTNGAINGQKGWSASAGAQVQSTYAVSGKALLLNAGANADKFSIFTTQTNWPWRVAFDFMFLTNALNYVGTAASLDIQNHLPQIRGPYPYEQALLVYKAGTTATSNFWGNLEVRGFTTLQKSAIDLQTGVWYHVEMVFLFMPTTTGSVDVIVTTNGATYWAPAVVNGLQSDGNINYMGFYADNTPDAPMCIDNIVTEYLKPKGALIVLR